MSAVALAGKAHAVLVQLAEISDRLGLAPVAVTLSANTYGGRRIAVQFGHDDRASVDTLGHELGIPVNANAHPTLHDRRRDVDGVEWATFCGVTTDGDTPAGVTA